MSQHQQKLFEAKRRAELAQKQIDDWLVDSKWNTEVAKVIEDAARLGVGVLCGPGKYRDWETDRKSTRLNSSHSAKTRMPSSA